jgi:hypothetical protein
MSNITITLNDGVFMGLVFTFRFDAEWAAPQSPELVYSNVKRISDTEKLFRRAERLAVRKYCR